MFVCFEKKPHTSKHIKQTKSDGTWLHCTQDEVRAALLEKEKEISELQSANERVEGDKCALEAEMAKYEEDLSTAQAQAEASQLRSEAQWQVAPMGATQLGSKGGLKGV